MYDVVIVGAGPPGSRLAYRLAEAGRDVVVLERGEPGPPLACSGHVSTDIWGYLPAGARSELLQNEVRGARFHVGGPGSRGYPFYKDEPVSNVVDRVGLDRALAARAEAAGAEVRTGHAVTDVTVDVGGVTVEVGTPDGPVEVRGAILAGCDGPASRVRRAVGLPEPDETLHGVLGFSEEDDHGDFVDVHLTVDRFFAWRIPRGDAGVEYGLAAPPGSDDLGGRLDELASGYGVDLVRRCSGMIPIGPPERVTADRVLLVGDAAAQTKPFTGGGILYGMRAADHAAATIDPADPDTLADYEGAWRRDLARDIRLGSWIRRAYGLPTPVQRLGLWALSGEIGVHMDRPTSLFSLAQLRAVLSRSGGHSDAQ
ncbi:MAG: geranylgeranyl reductase family protein [Halobacteriales archaeon]